MNNKSKIALSILTASILAGCGEESSVNVKEAPLPASIGVFVDDPVAGLGYRSESVENGMTNANGEFEYFRGEAITFFIGDLEFPSTAASSIITPLALFNTDTAFDQSVINTLRLLQTLDTDGDPSNGIDISSNAANVVVLPEETDSEGNIIPFSAETFFSQSNADFATDVETWLADAGSTKTTLVTPDEAIENFVNYIHTQYNSTQTNAFDLSVFTGTVFNPFITSGEATLEQMELTPDDDTNSAGSYTTFSGDEQLSAGSYQFLFGNRVLALTIPATDDSEASTQYIVARSYNTVDSVYSICLADSSSTLAEMVKSCDLDESTKDNLLTFSQAQTEAELIKLAELAELESFALTEDFNTDTETFFSSGYKRLYSEAGSGALYYRTGGSKPTTNAETGELILDADRFTIGNAAANPSGETSPADTIGSGIYNLSEGFTISFMVVDHNGSGSLSLYVDNNTASQGNSVHGAASKFYGKSVDDTNLPIGERFSYTYIPGEDVNPGEDDARGALNADIKNSFFQIRNDTGSNIVIDDLIIETVATDVPDIEPPVIEPPTGEVLATETFDTTAAELFTAAYKSLPDDGSAALYNVTSGSSRLTITDGVLSIDNARFSWGNSAPGTETADTDTTTTGVYDLSREYNIVFDIISASEPDDADQDNSFMIYVDNNSSSSSKSVHGGSSKFYSAKIAELAQLASGTTITVPGYLATTTSFLQLRAESGAVVEIDNLRIEYLESAGAKAFSCADEPELYFCDDFSAGNLDNWDIIATPDNTDGAVGFFDILDLAGNNVMRYDAGGAGGELILATEAAMANVPTDGNYFVEAKIRPRQNSTTANKQLFLMGRYVDTGNWYAGGLNVQNSSSSTQVEVAVSTDGSIARPVQKKSPILLGEKGGTEDGTWYSTRFEMIDGDLTVYLNGENMGSANDTTYTARGLIGIFTNNRSFELDDLKVGDPSVKPIQLTLDYKDPTWSTSTSGDALILNVSAFQNDASADTFTVTSSNDAVVSVTIDGTQVTLTPLTQGSATITLVSGSDSNIVRTIDIDVAAGFIMPTASYGDLGDAIMPAAASTEQYVDTSINITFDSAPTLNDTIGEVRIYNYADDTLVDTIKVGTDIDQIGYTDQDKHRFVYYTPLSVDGNTLTIKPHNNTLAYGKTYYVVIGDNVISNTQLNGVDFAGLGKNSDWTFTTKFNVPVGNSVLVDDDDDADFRTVQGALNYVMKNVAKDDAATVSVKNGTYNEMLFLRSKNNLTIQGESRDNTIIQYDNYETFNGGSGKSTTPGGTPAGGRSVFLVESADMLVFNNLTLKNSHQRSSEASNQAETIYFNSKYRLIANNANFISEQDTLLLKGYTWFYNTLVAGNVDFIWGYPVVSLFENTEIRTLGDSKGGDPSQDSSGGYVLQARVPVETDPGFVFLNSEFTHGIGPIGNDVIDNSAYIARSGGSASYFDNVTLINNKFDSHIATVGWAVQGVNSQPAPNPETPTAISGWREYGSMDISGNALDLSTRVGGYLLTESEAISFSSRTTLFASYDSDNGWDPQPLALPTLPDGPTEAAEVPAGEVIASEGFDTTADELFSANYKSLPNDSAAPLYNVTSGASRLTITDGKLTIDNARYSWGNTTPDTETADTDTVTTGVYDLSHDYNIIVDIISASEPISTDQGNSFFFYVDNNSSSSSKSIHGGDSKFFAKKITDLVAGTTLTIPGHIATSSSFIQVRAESGAVVEIDNLRIEYTTTQTKLALDYAESVWQGEANGDPLTINVTSLTDYDATADTFSVTSSDSDVASVSADGNVVTLTPLTKGTATITLVSDTDSSVTKTINVTVAAEQAADVVVDLGFAGYNYNITGGAGGTVVTVNNGVDLIAALDDAKSANTPVTIYVDGTITDANSGGSGEQINIKDMDNVSIIGVANRGELDGIGIAIRRANNIIIQNLKIHEVLTNGKDGISIENNDENATTANIWIDHNEIYADLAVDKDYYDGLLDSKAGAENITISYNYLHDSSKTSLHGHTDSDTNTNKNRNITFHHNRFENLVSRVPLFRFGEGHIYNNYYNNISSTAINSRMGAELHIENNYFENTQNPIVSFYSSDIGFWNISGNFFADTVTWTTPDSDEASGQDGSSTSSYVAPYTYTLDPVDGVKDHVIANAGIGKVNQSGLDIPDVTDTTPTEPPVQAAIGLPFNENFSATNADEFFSNSYRDLSGLAGSGTPLFHRVTGTIDVSSGQLTMTGARISIGNTTGATSTTADDATTTGVLDLSSAYQVSFKVVAIAGVTTKNFQIYVDNNTSGSSNSIHSGSSKFYSVALEDHVIGQTYVIDGLVASSTSFITIRTEGDATITIDDLKIE